MSGLDSARAAVLPQGAFEKQDCCSYKKNLPKITLITAIGLAALATFGAIAVSVVVTPSLIIPLSHAVVVLGVAALGMLLVSMISFLVIKKLSKKA